MRGRCFARLFTNFSMYCRINNAMYKNGRKEGVLVGFQDESQRISRTNDT